MANKLLQLPGNRLFNNSNIASPGGTATLYLSGTSTLANFLDSGGVPLGATITANGLGQLPNAYGDETVAYRMILRDSAGVQIDGGDIDPFYFGRDNNLVTLAAGSSVDTRTLLSQIATPGGNQSAILTESGRGGTFFFSTADLSAEVAADPLQGIYVPPSSDTTGASGAWVRALQGAALTDYMFGAVDGADNADAIEAWANFIDLRDVGRAACLSTGTLSRGISVGSTQGTALPATPVITFAPTLKATAAMDVMVTCKWGYCSVDWAAKLCGRNTDSAGATLSQRLAKVGISFSNSARLRSTGLISVQDCYEWAAVVDTAGNQNYAEIPYIRATYCGSSVKTGGGHVVSANWSTPALVGSANSTSQTTTIIVDAIPSDPAFSPLQRIVNIAGYPYRINSIASNGNGTWTLTLGPPWLDPTSVTAASGTLTYTCGGMLGIIGSNSNAVKSHGGAPAFCGFCVLDQSLTGAHIEQVGTNGQVDVYYGFGTGPDSSQLGGSIKGGYIESNACLYQVIDFSNSASINHVIGQWDGADGYDFTKWIKHGPRSSSSSTNLKNQQFDSIVSIEGAEGKSPVAQTGHTVSAAWAPGSIAAGGSATTTITVSGISQLSFRTRQMAVSFSLGLGGLVAYAYASSDNSTHTSTVITVRFYNPTAAAIDPGSGTVSVTLMRT